MYFKNAFIGLAATQEAYIQFDDSLTAEYV